MKHSDLNKLMFSFNVSFDFAITTHQLNMTFPVVIFYHQCTSLQIAHALSSRMPVNSPPGKLTPYSLAPHKVAPRQSCPSANSPLGKLAPRQTCPP